MSTSSPRHSYTITPVAYAIPLLHAAQHTASSILGLFLGRPSASSPSAVEIIDAVPLLHTRVSLSPMTELGLELVAEHAKSAGMQVVGLYTAGSENKGAELGRVGEQVLAALKSEFAGAFAFVIDNSKLDGSQCPYTVLSSTPSSSSPIPLPRASDYALLPEPFSSTSATLPTRAVFETIREKHTHRSLADLDDHLEDTSQDFLENKETKAALKRLLPS